MDVSGQLFTPQPL